MTHGRILRFATGSIDFLSQPFFFLLLLPLSFSRQKGRGRNTEAAAAREEVARWRKRRERGGFFFLALEILMREGRGRKEGSGGGSQICWTDSTTGYSHVRRKHRLKRLVSRGGLYCTHVTGSRRDCFVRLLCFTL